MICLCWRFSQLGHIAFVEIDHELFPFLYFKKGNCQLLVKVLAITICFTVFNENTGYHVLASGLEDLAYQGKVRIG